MKKLTVVNPTDDVRTVSGYPAFAPREERECDEATARYLTNGSGLVLKVVAADDKPAKKKTPNPA